MSAKTFIKENKLSILVSFCVFAIGIFVGVFVNGNTQNQPASVTVRENDGTYKFINPLLFTENQSPDTKKYQVVDDDLTSYIKNITSKNPNSEVSMYFRDLNTGKWFGVNENTQYESASLLKIAILIAYLRTAETDPEILDHQLKASAGSFNLDSVQNYKPKNPIQIGESYSVRSLLSSMIVDSDNNAMALLTQYIGSSSVNILYKDLQIPSNQDGTTSLISPELYSRFFRILYNSSYLSHVSSDAVLNLLSQTDFSNGLVAGVPAGTVISHKFGERIDTDSTGNPISRQLHDCGIVYYPGHPYFICVMTKGDDFATLEKTISSISKIVWDYVDREE
jgi:beta-lactamase class A